MYDPLTVRMNYFIALFFCCFSPSLSPEEIGVYLAHILSILLLTDLVRICREKNVKGFYDK